MAAPNMTISAVPPPAPTPGDLWYNDAQGFLFIYYFDGNTYQWVVCNPGIGGPGPAGPEGPPGTYSMPTRFIDVGGPVIMSVTDGEIVVRTAALVQVTLPPFVQPGFQARVSEGVGNDPNISVVASGVGKVSGTTDPTLIQYAWQSRWFRSLGNNDWSYL